MAEPLIASLARIADFSTVPYDVTPKDRSDWATGDYVLGEVTGESSALYHIEECNGDMIRVEAGALVIGALGERAATLEGVGSWTAIVDGKMHAMTSAGLFGAFTSVSRLLPRPMSLDYRGHITRGGKKCCMMDFAIQSRTGRFNVPTVLLVGTSMSAGKTKTGQLACDVLSASGLRVIGAKLTGAGRYRDIRRFKRRGAFEVYDFVDVGLPSTVVADDEFRRAIRPLLYHIDDRKPDFLVVEAGASPLEPYNGAAAIDELGDSIRCTILCASDPYAVVGVMDAFKLRPDLVTGPATSTSAAIDLVMKLTGIRAINIIDTASEPPFRRFLAETLGVSLPNPATVDLTLTQRMFDIFR